MVARMSGYWPLENHGTIVAGAGEPMVVVLPAGGGRYCKRGGPAVRHRDTPPSDDAIVYELEFLKAAGFNTVRKHIKIEPARWYWHCDRLGLLVWQDMPSGFLPAQFVAPGDAEEAL